MTQNTTTLDIGTLNVNGLRNKTRRRAILRQCKAHLDIVCLQETFADGALMQDISFEFPGFWLNSAALSHHSTGTAIGVLNTFGLTRYKDDDYVDNQGRIAGMALKYETGENFFVMSVYAPCCQQTTQDDNYNFLVKVSLKMFEMREKGYTVITGGDLNTIRDEMLDSKNGGTAFSRQQDWFNQLEASGNFFDVHRFHNPGDNITTWSHGKKNSLKRFRRLDYFLAPRSVLERTKKVKIIPTLSDHRLLVMSIEKKRERLKATSLWRNNDRLLANDDYCNTMENTITKALTEHDDAVVAWSWAQCRIREEAMKFGKTAAAARRAERDQLERTYLVQLQEAHPDTPATALRLQKFYHDEDAAIRFRAKVDEAESNEKISPYFFARIKQNESKSNIETIKTSKYPNGTSNSAETLDALESHYKAAFSDDTPSVNVPNHWWDGLPQLSELEQAHLDKPLVLNDYTTALFKDMSLGKSPGSDGITVAFYRKFWHILAKPFMACMKNCTDRGQLSNTQKESIIRLIEKKGKDSSTLKGFRPISLMNVDSKIYSKTLTNRLKSVCNKVLGNEQLA
jgi:exonuclease III